MKDLLMSQTGFWSAFTIIFMLVVMGWFIFKVNKISKEAAEKKKHQGQ